MKCIVINSKHFLIVKQILKSFHQNLIFFLPWFYCLWLIYFKTLQISLWLTSFEQLINIFHAWIEESPVLLDPIRFLILIEHSKNESIHSLIWPPRSSLSGDTIDKVRVVSLRNVYTCVRTITSSRPTWLWHDDWNIACIPRRSNQM